MDKINNTEHTLGRIDAEVDDLIGDGLTEVFSNPEEQINNPLIVEHNRILGALLLELKPINFHEKADLAEGVDLTRKHYTIICIEVILELAKENNFSLCMSDQQVYVFNGAFYKSLTKEQLGDFLGRAAEKLGVDRFEARHHSFRVELMKQFLSTAFLAKPVKNKEEILINLINGTFVINDDEQKLRDFDRNDFIKYQLPFAYDSEATAPVFSAYLRRVLPDEKLQMILAEYLGYLFIRPSKLKLEKCLILYGSGANGKSVLFEIINALLGAENVCNFSLQSLTNESGYYRAKLSDKLLNYASEISAKMDSTLFKQLVSGEPIEARLPYGDPFVLEDYAKLIFNTNELPKDVEHNEAFFRRFIILHFGVTIPESERNPQLASDIIKDELPGVFNWVLSGLCRIIKQKKFTHSELVENTIDQYKIQSNSVRLFLEDENYTINVNSEIPLKQIYPAYKEYCFDFGYKACGLKSFSERLRHQGFETTRRNRGMVVNAVKKPF
ncbi:DNA primase family protein [Segetibacter koreensis]|uniref:DNA primase family protein n=1 Tax=Segetibacter koreensis TaxID=398037 RepID=UPI0003806503|nr:DNA primase family protein [Segetibacter koreensis]